MEGLRYRGKRGEDHLSELPPFAAFVAIAIKPYRGKRANVAIEAELCYGDLPY